MTHDSHEPLDIRQVRLFVDGEMAAETRADFEQRLAADEALQQRVDFERQLRRQVAQTMAAAAPAGLAEEVRARLRRELAPGAALGRVDAEGATSERWRWLSDPRRANAAAVAATLALVAGAVLWGILGNPIDQVAPLPEAGAAEAARYVDDEHMRCVLDEDLLRTRAPIRRPRELLEACMELLGAEPVLPDLAPAGYEFFGGGRCEVPGRVESIHIVYRRCLADQPPATVSIFALPNVGQFNGLTPGGLLPGGWYQVTTEPAVSHRVDCATDGRLVYFLVCCDQQDVPAVARTIGAELRR